MPLPKALHRTLMAKVGTIVDHGIGELSYAD